MGLEFDPTCTCFPRPQNRFIRNSFIRNNLKKGYVMNNFEAGSTVHGHTTTNLTLGRLKQEDLKFVVRLRYVMSSSSAWLYSRSLYQIYKLVVKKMDEWVDGWVDSKC